MTNIASSWLKELNNEVPATERCLERISENTWEFKPHPKSMPMGYLALLVAEIPRWITVMIEEAEIDFATFKHAQLKTTGGLMAHFNENITNARRALQNATDSDVNKIFYLKADGKEIFHASNAEYIGPTLNHWVHHRGQLSVYMRLCDIPVPSIYGPSADDNPYR
jgi:uncharacterized damage-inducible protein DinB